MELDLMPDTLKGLAGLQTDLNSKHIGHWPHWVGQFVLNFAGIELISYQLLNRLEGSRADFNRNLALDLSVRISRIRKLIKKDARLDSSFKAETDELWAEVTKNLKWRNRIAHNPVLLSWKPGSNPETDPPDELGIMDARELKKGDECPSLSLATLKELVRWTFEIGDELNRRALAIGAILPDDPSSP